MQRVVTLLPLTELWDQAGPVPAVETRDLDAEDIRALLRLGPVRFVLADVGHPLRWVEATESFEFWKGELQTRIAKATAQLEDFRGGSCYFASEWIPLDGPPIVVLAVAH